MKYFVITVLLVIAGYVGYQLWQEQQTPAESESMTAEDKLMEAADTSREGMVEGTDKMAGEYTLAEVAAHDNKDDCYLVMDGKVYDVTPFVKSGLHPGKEAILLGCGKDATSLFNDRPNGSGAHSDRAREMLPKYEIGVLAAN